MKVLTLEGIIDRRILINFAVDKDVLSRFLPSPFSPRLVHDKGVAGICLIRMKNIRPKGFPELIAIDSENAAHRIAVEWTENGQTKQGVYIPRRDTNSLINHLAGGHLFPGVHYLAEFDINENQDSYNINIVSEDKNVISLSASPGKDISEQSIFENLETASEFFKNGAVGFSPNKTGYDGVELKISKWQVSPLSVDNVKSSFFENEVVFPKGSVKFDNALLMRNVEHQWESYESSPDK